MFNLEHLKEFITNAVADLDKRLVGTKDALSEYKLFVAEAKEALENVKPNNSQAVRIPLEQFKAGVRINCFTNDDGYGYLSSRTGCIGEEIKPSDVFKISFPPIWTHVVWFNK